MLEENSFLTAHSTPVGKKNKDENSNILDDLDIILAQAKERVNPFYKSLLECFHVMRESRETDKPLFFQDPTEGTKEAKIEGVLNQVAAALTVNFIDPTTNSNQPGPKADNMLAQQMTNKEPVVENVYEKLTHIFERDYSSTLRSIQYKNLRSGENDVISSLPIKPVLFRAGNAPTDASTANVPWGGSAGAGTVNSAATDPSEWHNAPFCHVYIAACSGLDHYRNKIRPSLQAFVSQIEAAATQPQLSNGGGQGGQSAHFLIVYIPTGTKEDEGTPEKTEPGKHVRRAVADRLSMVKRRFVNPGMANDLDSSLHSKDSLDSADILDDNEESEAATVSLGLLSLLSRNERSIYKKMVADFPNSKVCALSLGSLEKSGDDAISSNGIGVRTQEWNSFNRLLGAVIVNGFKDRCRRYQDELRRLDAQRASEATAAKSEKAKNAKKAPVATFNLSYFFLVKESLAFTYEQMQLPSEALKQYDEFRAFLPDLSDDEYARAKRHRKDCKALTDEDSGPNLMEIADAGDFTEFRKKLRPVLDLNPILDIMRRYLFARELCLLTKMEQPAELVARCRKFIKMVYTVMMRGANELPPRGRKKRKLEAAKWVIQFSWDVKCASEQFLISIAEAAKSMGDADSVSTPRSLSSDASDSTQSEKALATQLGEILEVSRLFYKELGDAEFGATNPIRHYDKSLPADMSKPWQPWTPTEVNAVETKKDEVPRVALIKRASVPDATVLQNDRMFLLDNAFSSIEAYEDRYLEIAAALITFHIFAGRRRFAARLQSEIAESFVRNGNLVEAAKVFKKTVKICRFDHWDRCHFYRLFRLAYCQRTTAKPSEYLKTLVSAFSPRTTAVAPAKALEVLQEDLEAVIGHQSVGEARYGKLAFLETQMKVQDISTEVTNMSNNFDRKQMVKKYITIGENVQISVTLNSNLPKAIHLDSLQLFIVAFDTFSTIIGNRESVEEEDAFKVLSRKEPITLEPGKNTFTFDWAPTSAGQFILSTAEIVWKQGYFYYDSLDLPDNLQGIDILPSEPTHTLSLNPECLLPGHDQEVRIQFDAVKDVIRTGKLLLSCSNGLTLIPPGEDPAAGNWQDSCEIDLGTYKPGETKLFTTHVRCGLIQNSSHASITEKSSLDVAHGVSVKASTTYLHPDTEESEDSDAHAMKNVIEAFAPILEKTALSVEGVDLVWISPGKRAIVSINLVSNTPRHFSVNEWELVLPSPLQGTDLNGDLIKCQVSDGDELALAFDCSVVEENGGTSSDEPILKIKLCDDTGKEFSLDLSIDLDAHYLKLFEESSPKLSANVSTTLVIDSDEGNVGEPVMMTFSIDPSGLESHSLEEVSYSISSEGSDWLIGGQVNGIVDKSCLSYQVIGIPAVPGQLVKFPKLLLRHSSLKGDSISLETRAQNPSAFQSYATNRVSAVAHPT